MNARQHPAGLTALASSVLVIVAAKTGLDLSAEEAVVIVGFLTALVSRFTPRTIA